MPWTRRFPSSLPSITTLLIDNGTSRQAQTTWPSSSLAHQIQTLSLFLCISVKICSGQLGDDASQGTHSDLRWKGKWTVCQREDISDGGPGDEGIKTKRLIHNFVLDRLSHSSQIYHSFPLLESLNEILEANRVEESHDASASRFVPPSLGSSSAGPADDHQAAAAVQGRESFYFHEWNMGGQMSDKSKIQGGERKNTTHPHQLPTNERVG
uniref:Uncharacterized protein n=1 Tax=Triticum aestivum TaxID=4565 RepID=A0A077RX32_WHEAT|nr:unnamed protein product [Triticum aestivum]